MKEKGKREIIYTKDECAYAKGKISAILCVERIKKCLCKIGKKVLAIDMSKKIRKVAYDVMLVVIIPVVTIVYNEISEELELINDINNITIGQSCDYLDECFGVPFFQKKHEEYNIDERIYNTKYAVIRSYCEENKLIAFFVTAKKENGKVGLSKRFEKLCNYKKLGKFAFTEIMLKPTVLEAYATNGSGHTYYSENYYFASAGNYYTFYFMYLDYGFDAMEYDSSVLETDPELANTNIDKAYAYSCVDRNKSRPNTYGIIDEGQEEIIDELVSSYLEFDFRALNSQ